MRKICACALSVIILIAASVAWTAPLPYTGNQQEGSSITRESKAYLYTSSGQLADYTTYEYTSSGLMAKSSMFSPTGSLTDYIIYQYNASGLQSQEFVYDASGQMSGYDIDEYNASGQLTQFSEYGPTGTLEGYSTFEYTMITPVPTPTACTASVDGNLLLHIPYLSYGNGTLSLSADLLYNANPSYPSSLPFVLISYGIISDPSFSCAASTLSSGLSIHIPDVLLSDGTTHLSVDFAYSPVLSIDGNIYFVLSNYVPVSN